LIQGNLADVKRALQGGRPALLQLNAEFVAAQIQHHRFHWPSWLGGGIERLFALLWLGVRSGAG
jgi:hypothetical protein